jgi:UDP-N-acetylglucosamine 4-epimerase
MLSFHSNNLNNYSFLITGGSGFIGSNIVEYLLKHNAGKVVVLDDLSTGSIRNISPFTEKNNFHFINGDIRNADVCRKSCEGIDFVLHQAALGSVPRSISDPLNTHSVNSTGFLNMIIAARDAKVNRFVYASSSSVYGDHPGLPKKEEQTGNPLSPYAVSKKTNELYARVFAETYKMEIIGLRYFNVFGPNQSPDGPYAAVIPLFMQNLLENKSPFIDGDGEQSRDFTYVENAVQANIRALFASNPEALNRIYNVAVGERVTVNELFNEIAGLLKSEVKPVYRSTRPGDVRDSLADISAAKKFLGYEPTIRMKEGLSYTMDWFRQSIIKTM